MQQDELQEALERPFRFSSVSPSQIPEDRHVRGGRAYPGGQQAQSIETSLSSQGGSSDAIASELPRPLHPRSSRLSMQSDCSSRLGSPTITSRADLEKKVSDAVRGIFIDDSVMFCDDADSRKGHRAPDGSGTSKWTGIGRAPVVSGSGSLEDSSSHRSTLLQERRSALMAKVARESDSILATISGESRRGSTRQESGSVKKALASATPLQASIDALPEVHV